MSFVVITGSNGLIGSEAAAFYAKRGFFVLGIDNDMRAYFFGESASTRTQTDRLRKTYGASFRRPMLLLRRVAWGRC